MDRESPAAILIFFIELWLILFSVYNSDFTRYNVNCKKITGILLFSIIKLFVILILIIYQEDLYKIFKNYYKIDI